MRGRLVECKEFSCASEDEGVLELRKIRFQECRDGLLLPEETSTISRDISISISLFKFSPYKFWIPISEDLSRFHSENRCVFFSTTNYGFEGISFTLFVRDILKETLT